jgi:hypothetical protein
MDNFVPMMLRYLTALALCSIIAPAAGHTKEKSPSKSQSSDTFAVKKQGRLADLDGYRWVNATLRCKESLQGTLECKQ